MLFQNVEQIMFSLMSGDRCRHSKSPVFPVPRMQETQGEGTYMLQNPALCRTYLHSHKVTRKEDKVRLVEFNNASDNFAHLPCPHIR